MADRQPKYEYGDVVTNTQTGKRTIIKKALFDESIVKNGFRTTGFKKTFNGEYYCFWHDDNGETIYGNISEDFLEKP